MLHDWHRPMTLLNGLYLQSAEQSRGEIAESGSADKQHEESNTAPRALESTFQGRKLR